MPLSMHTDTGCFNEAAGIRRGRHLEAYRDRLAQRRLSMRPRVFAAEDLSPTQRCATPYVASMRPRVFAAEDDFDVFFRSLHS